MFSSAIVAPSLLGAVSSASAGNDGWQWKSFETRKDSDWQHGAVTWLERLGAEVEDVRCNLFEGHKFFLWAKNGGKSGDRFEFVTRSWKDSDWPAIIAGELDREEAVACGFNTQAKVWILKKS